MKTPAKLNVIQANAPEGSKGLGGHVGKGGR